MWYSTSLATDETCIQMLHFGVCSKAVSGRSVCAEMPASREKKNYTCDPGKSDRCGVYAAPTPQDLHDAYSTAPRPRYDSCNCNDSAVRYASLANIELIARDNQGLVFHKIAA